MAESFPDPQREIALRELCELHYLDEQELRVELMHLEEAEPAAQKRPRNRGSAFRMPGPGVIALLTSLCRKLPKDCPGWLVARSAAGPASVDEL